MTLILCYERRPLGQRSCGACAGRRASRSDAGKRESRVPVPSAAKGPRSLSAPQIHVAERTGFSALLEIDAGSANDSVGLIRACVLQGKFCADAVQIDCAHIGLPIQS